ncbi:hypothetical protein CVT26_002333 [Gymnopilus dilepis]|uniref:FYVE-type domain-containing protein n=1 Tax=Gymnopilus dilepis TaxID=231916 RepID=A0A409Y3I3_9AGAR|nr:hypothetical protein CVT26_002333 [Gymnopilus dilepis]
MASGSTVPPSSVNFPITETSPQKHVQKPGSPLKPPHLPFRRISLPTAPSLMHRVSVVSVSSFDSFPEDEAGSPQQPSTSHQNMRGTSPVKSAKVGSGRPISTAESPRRRTRARRESSVKPGPLEDRLAPKRRKVVDEFYETEKAYVDGLELIYSHFLAPIIASLDTSEPLLDRSALTAIFSNFIDIWNLHRSFLAALTSLLESTSNAQDPSTLSSLTKSSAERNSNINSNAKLSPPPNLSPLLLAHFPYLSLYTPFITSFPSTISSLNALITPPTALRPNAQYNQHFASFISIQESDPACRKLKLRDWLLTIVQRCPRYLLLLKDLIGCTSKEDPEYGQLTAVHTLVSKITSSLNTSLHTHSQTLALLAIQKSTPNLPFQLISPGRTFLKRGTLLQSRKRSPEPVEREFLLFSDCLIWLASSDSDQAKMSAWDWAWSGSGSGASGSGLSQSTSSTPIAASNVKANIRHSAALPPPSAYAKMERPPMARSRSKSEAELSSLKMENSNSNSSSTSSSDSSTNPSTSSAGSGSALSKGNGTATPDSSVPSTPISTPPVTPKRLTRIRSSLLAPLMGSNSASSASASAQSLGPATVHSTPTTPRTPPPPPSMPKRPKRHPSSDDKDARWVFKGRVELVDVQVVVGAGHGALLEEEGDERWAFEVLSPDGSFVLYASSEQERDEWTSEIRSAKAQLLTTLNITHPNSTLTSSASTQHVRKVLQALPYPPSDERLATVRASASLDVLPLSEAPSAFKYKSKKEKAKDKEKEKGKDKSKRGSSVPAERRRKVEHWVPAIWIPDGKTSSCMRCGRMFGWRRRRHHCRLCGRCVCAGCSGRTFFISDGTKSDASSKPARACDACYETVFPVVDSPEDQEDQTPEDDHATYVPSKDTISSLARLPSLLSMPALPVYGSSSGSGDKEKGPLGPQALMAIDLDVSVGGGSKADDVFIEEEEDAEDMGDENDKRARMISRVKSHQRLRSYQQILEDFQAQQRQERAQQQQREAEEEHDHDHDEDGEEEDDAADDDEHSEVHSLASPSLYPYSHRRQRPVRREDTARRSKRFSLPAVALHATSVTARTSVVESGGSGYESPTSATRSRESSSDIPSPLGFCQGRSRRFSLVLAGRNSHYYADEDFGGGGAAGGADLAKGVAAAKLSELLGRKVGPGGGQA